jgi:hypothetical protein
MGSQLIQFVRGAADDAEGSAHSAAMLVNGEVAPRMHNLIPGSTWRQWNCRYDAHPLLWRPSMAWESSAPGENDSRADELEA